MESYKTQIQLTIREKEIISLVAAACSNKQIAEKLFISIETVKKHMKNIYCKLGVKNKIGALKKCGHL